MAVLDAYDPQPLEPPTFLYRGQSHRFFRRWPPRDETVVPQDSYVLDSIIPSDYRHLEGLIRVGSLSDPAVNLVHSNDITRLRGIAVYVAIGQVNANQTQKMEVDNWLQTIYGPQLYDHLGSVAQHCGLPTGYADLTANNRVALWFATHDWHFGNYTTGGTGVIYRINREILSQAQEALNTMNGWQGGTACRLIDIRNTPLVLTARPHQQHGFSLAGIESPWLLMELLRRGGIKAYLFDRGSTASAANPLQQQDITPTPDAMYQILSDMRHNHAHQQDFQTLADAAFQQGQLTQQFDLQDSALHDSIFVGWQ